MRDHNALEPGTTSRVDIAALPVEEIPLAQLVPTPENEAIFGPGSPPENDELAWSMSRDGQRRAALVVRDAEWTPSTPRYRVVWGHRRRLAALALGWTSLRCQVLSDITEEEVAVLLVVDNLQPGTRAVSGEEVQFRCEQHVRVAMGRSRGFRSDLQAEEQGQGDTDDLIAKKLGTTRTAVRARQKVFASPLSTDMLRERVCAGRMRREPAAELVREAERRVRDGLSADEARSMLDAAVESGVRAGKERGTEARRVTADHDAEAMMLWAIFRRHLHRAKALLDEGPLCEEFFRAIKLMEKAAALLADAVSLARGSKGET